MGYLAELDKLYFMTSISFSKKKVRLGQTLQKEEVRVKTTNPLTRRQLFSQIPSLYNPIGLVVPVKKKGAILFRREFQGTG